MNWKTETSQNLIKAFLLLETGDDVRRFLRDLMTEEEIEEFSKRLKAAQMLSKKQSYLKIAKITGLSSTTIARVSRWLNRGQGGYKNILAKLDRHSQSFR